MIPLRHDQFDAIRDAGLAIPAYDRGAVTAGIAHIGVGNFHRAHQALALERVLALPGQQGWGICGIGLGDSASSRARAGALGAQDCLYSLTEYDFDGSARTRVIGALLDYLVARDDPGAVLDRLADPAIRIVSLTITEGGYNLDADRRFRADTDAVRYDLAHPDAPRTAFGYIVAALRRRRAAGIAPFTVMSCDNQRDNGAVARIAVTGFARAHDPELARWIEDEVAFPNSMVDRIVPTMTDEMADAVRRQSDLDDASPVVAEIFSQWVLEDRFCNGRPPFEQVGVELVEQVAPYEAMKGRLLNGAHMMLCFPGLLSGYRLADEAMRDPALAAMVRRFMESDVLPGLAGPPGVDLDAYRDTVLRRFANPAIGDRLARIASDGASKVPTFLTATIGAAIRQGRALDRLALLIACFGLYFAGRDGNGGRFDPQEPAVEAAERTAIAADPRAILHASFLSHLDLDGSPAFVAAFDGALAAVRAGSLPALIAGLG